MANNVNKYEWCKFSKSGTKQSADKVAETSRKLIDKKPLKAKTPIKKVSKNKEIVSKKTYNTVFERDKGKCRLCEKINNLALHHIVYRSQDKSRINDVTNCIMLCTECHLLVHSNKKKYKPILEELIK